MNSRLARAAETDPVSKGKKRGVRQWWHTPLVPALRKPRQEDSVSFRPARIARAEHTHPKYKNK